MVATGRTLLLISVAVASLMFGACGDDESTTTSVAGRGDAPIDVGDGGDYRPQVDPADFVAGIDNPWLPFTPGSRWVYEAQTEDGLERIEIVVTDDAKSVMGIAATVVRDTVTLEGRPIEDTWDWYAQDRDGNVWYLGEDTKEYDEDGSVSTEGSWEGGVDGALPGIVMQADPQVGQAYRQEFYVGEAEDLAEIARTGETADVRAGRFEDAVVILEWNPFEPDVLEEKYYAKGTGVVLEQQVRGGDERVELVEYTPGR